MGETKLAKALQMAKRSPGCPHARTAWKAVPTPLSARAIALTSHVSRFSIKTQEFAEFQEAPTSLCQPVRQQTSHGALWLCSPGGTHGGAEGKG